MPRYVDIEKYEKAYIGMDIAVNFSDGAMVGCAGEVFAKVVPVSKLPTADVQEVKHGKWIKTMLYECSACKVKSVGKSNYCPNCGAMMFKEEEK